jgi:predicted molibdopterin-dependent oxidoreductase YjgC
VQSRRGEVVLRANVNQKTIPGVVFMPFHFAEAAANFLTNDALDPEALIPEFKACAVKIEKVTEDQLPTKQPYQPRGRY